MCVAVLGISGWRYRSIPEWHAHNGEEARQGKVNLSTHTHGHGGEDIRGLKTVPSRWDMAHAKRLHQAAHFKFIHHENARGAGPALAGLPAVAVRSFVHLRPSPRPRALRHIRVLGLGRGGEPEHLQHERGRHRIHLPGTQR